MTSITDEDDKLIGKRIQYFREKKGLSRLALSKQIGITHTSLTRYENSIVNNMKICHLIEIARVLNVSIYNLINVAVDCKA